MKNSVIVSKRNGEKVVLYREEIQKLLDKGETLKNISRHYNLQMTSFTYSMTKLGVTYNKKNSISDYIKPEEIQRCLNNNMSIEEIAEKFNCSVWPIRRIINENNLRAKSKKRNLSEIEKLSNKYNVSLEVIKKVIETELDILGRSGIIKKYSLYK